MDTKLVTIMIEWEQGNLNRVETIKLFQVLIDTRLVWRLANHYGRTAMQLIDGGFCSVEPFKD